MGAIGAVAIRELVRFECNGTTYHPQKDRHMRILIVSLWFPPYNNVGAVRMGKTAEHLIARGHEVHVISASPQPFPANLETTFPDRLVRRTFWLAPPQALDRPTRNETPLVSARRRSRNPLLRHAYRTSRWAYHHAVYLPDKFVSWFPFAAITIAAQVRRESFDVVLASSGPPTALLACSAALRGTQTPWVAEFRDLWAGNHFETHSGWQASLDRRLEKVVVDSAAAIVAVNDFHARTLEARYRRPVTVVSNGYDRTWEEDSLPEPISWRNRDDKVRLLFTGTYLPSRHDFAPLFRAVSSLGADASRFHLDFVGPDTHLIAPVASRFGLSGIVSAEPPVPRRTVLSLQTCSDVLLLPTSPEAVSQEILPAKFFDYVAAGVPILALAPEGSAVARASDDLGLVTQDSRRIAAWLSELMSTPASARSARSRRRPPAGLSRVAQLDILENLLAEVASAAKSPACVRVS